MLRSRIIPSLLLSDGGLVKTVQFSHPKYVGDPLNAVKVFNEKQVDELSLFDIDATVKKREPDYERLRTIAMQARMPLCYGGGITNKEQAGKIVSLGYEKISMSSAVLENPSLLNDISSLIGSQSVVVTIDVRKNRLLGGYSLYTHNAKKKINLDLVQTCKQLTNQGAGEIAINSIDNDGMMNGYDLELARMIRSAVTTPLTFIGGAGSVLHMQELIESVGVVGAAAASMFVFNGPYKAVLLSYSRPQKLA